MNDDLTTRLSRQLHEQVDDWQTTPLTLDGVRGRARSIRRTRRIVATAAVAAVIAIAAPVAVLAGGGLDAGPDPTLPPATDNPSEAVDTANPEIEGSGLGVPYLQGRTLTMTDGSEQELPRAYDSAVVLGDRVLAVRIDTDNGQATLDRIQGGEVVSSESLADFTLARNAGGSAVAYSRADGQLVVEAADGQTSLLGEHPGTPVDLTGGPECTEQPPGSCTVFVNTGDGEGRSVDPQGAGTLAGSPMAIQDVSATTGRIAELMSIDEIEPGSCSRVVATDTTVFETCDFTPVRFSPDGAYLSAGPDYRDGIGDGFVAILDGDTGEQAARFEPEDGFLNTSVWEDPEHLLTIAYDYGGGTWSVVRLGADDSTETVLGPVEGGEMQPPWRLVGAG